MNTKIKILIVEHDLNDIELLQYELKQSGIDYESEIVQNETDFSTALKKFVPDIILSDYALPAFNGVTAFKIKEEITPDIPFILISGTIGEENAVELIKNGVTDYVLKDKLFTLNPKLNRALEESKAKKQKNKTDKEILLKNEQLKNLTSHLQHIREQERTTISREIHDELGQQLTALKMDIDWVRHKQNNPDKVVVSRLDKMLEMSNELISTIRRISSDLRPAIIDDLGLIAALEWKCNDFEEKMGIPCLFISSIKERKFENNFGINTYRILQETLTNVSRHAAAKSVTVSVSENKTELLLEISDDGKGIDNESVGNGKTLGIIGMKERAILLGGKLTIEGIKNKGTRTKLILPLKNEHTNS